jgi:hypothetical protein
MEAEARSRFTLFLERSSGSVQAALFGTIIVIVRLLRVELRRFGLVELHRSQDCGALPGKSGVGIFELVAVPSRDGERVEDKPVHRRIGVRSEYRTGAVGRREFVNSIGLILAKLL